MEQKKGYNPRKKKKPREKEEKIGEETGTPRIYQRVGHAMPHTHTFITRSRSSPERKRNLPKRKLV
jgi:hypothetical protein